MTNNPNAFVSVPREVLEVVEQAFREINHAYHSGPGWYTRGENGLRQQVRLWLDKGASATATALAAPSAPVVSGEGADILIKHLNSQIDEWMKCVDELEKALEPFAAIADGIPEDQDGRESADRLCSIYLLQVGDFRRARAALKQGGDRG